MHTFFNPNAPFPTWQQFLARPDNKGLNVMQAKQKYLNEQANYYRMIPPTPSFASATAGAGSTSTDTGPVLLLDIAGATDNLLSAVSFRKLSSTYNGDCCKVWRNSDSAELDIGFTSEGYVDIDAIETFSGGSERVYVLTWYDQNGSNNFTSTKTTTNSPFVTDASGNILKNGDFVYLDDGS